MKLGELMEELNCKYYYIVELDDDMPIDVGLPEYYVAADDIDSYLRDMTVRDYSHVSKRFAVVYLDREIEDLTFYLDKDKLIDILMKILE